MSDDSHILDLLSLYALGTLDEEEERLVSEHLSTCVQCQVELQAYQTVADQMPLALAEFAPPAGLKPKLLARVKDTEKTAGSAATLSWWQRLVQAIRGFNRPAWPQAAVIGLILILAASNLLLWQQVNELRQSRQPGSLMSLPLDNTEVIPDAKAYILISADGHNGGLVVDQLPMLDPTKQQYQLWLVRDGQRTSAAILDVNEAGYGWVRVFPPESLFTYTSLEITIEPAGGSPAPTGDQIFHGSLIRP